MQDSFCTLSSLSSCCKFLTSIIVVSINLSIDLFGSCLWTIRLRLWASYPEWADFARWRTSWQSRPSRRPRRRWAVWSSAGSKAPAGCSGLASPSAELGSQLRTTRQTYTHGQTQTENGEKERKTPHFCQGLVQKRVLILQPVSLVHHQHLPVPPEQQRRRWVVNMEHFFFNHLSKIIVTPAAETNSPSKKWSVFEAQLRSGRRRPVISNTHKAITRCSSLMTDRPRRWWAGQ